MNDAGPTDSGSNPLDAGTHDAGTHDAGAVDAGAVDAGAVDAGAVDGGAVDAGPGDAGAPDAGTQRDDAGCPLPTGLVLDAADAGLPATGLVLWLRADRAVATLDGGAVCRWEDVSGNGRHFLPSSASLPRLEATALSGRSAVVFATGNYLTRPDVLGLGGNQGRTIASRTQSADTTRRWATFIQGTRANNWQYIELEQNTFMTSGSLQGVYVTANAYDSTVVTDGGAHTHVYSISSLNAGTQLPGALVYSVDGVVQTLTRTQGGNGPNGPGDNLVWDFSGANYTSIGETAVNGFAGGSVGEVLVYDHALSSTERAAVEAHLTP